MNSSAAIFVVCLCLGASSALSFPSFDPIKDALTGISYEITSTYGVVKELCFNKDIHLTPQLATDFFNCYDAAPAGGRAIYTACQIYAGGVQSVMNTTEGIKNTCAALYTFPKYGLCLKNGFKEANIDMHVAVTLVNKCEEEVLGIGA